MMGITPAPLLPWLKKENIFQRNYEKKKRKECLIIKKKFRL